MPRCVREGGPSPRARSGTSRLAGPVRAPARVGRAAQRKVRNGSIVPSSPSLALGLKVMQFRERTPGAEA